MIKRLFIFLAKIFKKNINKEKIFLDNLVTRFENQPLVPLATLTKKDIEHQSGAYEIYHFFNEIYAGKGVGKKQHTMWDRIREHKRSLNKTYDLDINDFQIKFISFAKDIENLALSLEQELIDRKQHYWNTVLTGFGEKCSKKVRLGKKLTPWDIKYPGRFEIVSENKIDKPISENITIDKPISENITIDIIRE